MNKLDKDYQELLRDILEKGTIKNDRTGTGTISVFGRQIRHKMSDGFPLLTTKKMYTKGVITELIWFLRGDTNIKYLIDNDCHIWDGDAYQSYLKEKVNKKDLYESDRPLTKEEFINKIKIDDDFAKKWGELGPIYGKQWVNWGGFFSNGHAKRDGTLGVSFKGINQISNLIKDLNTNPDSRRLMVSAWNVAEIGQTILPPCHYSFQIYTRELSAKERIELAGGKIQEKYPALIVQSLKVCDERNIPTRAISLMWNQRSCDFPLGIPYNIASYGFLLTLISKQVNMIPDELIGNLGDCHIYKNQIEGCQEQLTRDSYKLPTLIISNKNVLDISEYTFEDFKIKNYISHPTIKFPLSN